MESTGGRTEPGVETAGLAEYLSDWYAVRTLAFPDGVPDFLQTLPPITIWHEPLVNPAISQIEMTLVYEALTTTSPRLEVAQCGLTVEMLHTTVVNPETGCWERRAHVISGGQRAYNKISVVALGLKSAPGHRVFWQELVGNHTGIKLAPDDVLDHRCNNKACCYPRHLRLTDKAGNNKTAGLDGRPRNGQPPLFVMPYRPLE